MALRTKIALIVIAAVFGLLAAATLLRAIDNQRTFMLERSQQGLALAQTLADLIGRDALPLDDLRVQALVTEYGRSSGVSLLRVVDRTLTVVAASRPEQVGRTYRHPDLAEAVRHGTLATEVKRGAGDPTLHIMAPVRNSGALVGAVELQMDLRDERTDLAAFVRQGALVAALVAAVMTLLLLWLLTLVVVQPVTQYAKLTQEMARGEFSVDFPVRGSDEIGQLGRALARTRDSLREMSALWKDQNPLSGLPGNRAIERELRRRLDAGDACVVLYVDLDNFKAFNDRYGFERGDDVLRFMAKTLQSAVAGAGGGGDFVGHIGGDDFVLAVAPERAEAIAEDTIRRFDAGIPEFYDQTDRARGYIELDDRHGRPARVPVAGLTLVGVTVAPRFTTPLKIGEEAAELKVYAKRVEGSKFMMDRRAARPSA